MTYRMALVLNRQTVGAVTIILLVAGSLLYLSNGRETTSEKFIWTAERPSDASTNPIIIPEIAQLEKMTKLELEELYFSYIENIQTLCTRQHHIGSEKDGGYHICEDVMDNTNDCLMYSFGYIENIQTFCTRQRHLGNESDGGYHICEDAMDNTNDCLMYSFGNRKDYSFDDGVAQRYGCEVHSFDPFDGQVDHVHSPKVTFHALGISGHDDPEGKLLTVGTIKHKLNHSKRKIDILKIDTEGAEWDSLEKLSKGHFLEEVKLLIVEFHICVFNCFDGKHRLHEQYVQYLSTLRRIHNLLGFHIYFLRMWPLCNFAENGITRTTCHEVHMIRRPH